MNLYYGTFFEGQVGDKPVSKYKLICHGPEEKVVGIHLIGEFNLLVLNVRCAVCDVFSALSASYSCTTTIS